MACGVCSYSTNPSPLGRGLSASKGLPYVWLEIPFLCDVIGLYYVSSNMNYPQYIKGSNVSFSISAYVLLPSLKGRTGTDRMEISPAETQHSNWAVSVPVLIR